MSLHLLYKAEGLYEGYPVALFEGEGLGEGRFLGTSAFAACVFVLRIVILLVDVCIRYLSSRRSRLYGYRVITHSPLLFRRYLM